MATVTGILAAIIERGKTGKGKLVESSLLRTGIYTGGSDMSIQLMFGNLATSKSRHEAPSPTSNFFLTKDDYWIALVPRQGQKDWAGVCRALGHPDLIEDERFATPKARRTHAAALADIMDATFREHDSEYWRERLDAEDQIWSPMQHPRDVVEDEQAHAAGGFVDIAGPDGKPAFKSPAGTIRFSDVEDGMKAPAPGLGEHTEEVMRAAGVTDEEWKARSEERRVGNECRSRWWPDQSTKKREEKTYKNREDINREANKVEQLVTLNTYTQRCQPQNHTTQTR